MDGDVLGTEEVVTRRQRLRDGEREGSTVLGWESDLAATECRVEFGDFEPRCAAVGGAGGGDFGHVESSGVLATAP